MDTNALNMSDYVLNMSDYVLNVSDYDDAYVN